MPHSASAARRPRRPFWPAALAALLLAAPIGARACSVMIDTSGSMAGFRGGAAFAGLLSYLAGACANHFTFGADLAPAPADLGGLRYNATTTRLGPSLAQWLRVSTDRRLLILTDNVADDGHGGPDQAQQQFYDLMRAPGANIRRIAVVLMRLPFEGAVFSADDRRTGRYAGGDRAVMLYVIERGAGPGSAAPPREPGLSLDDPRLAATHPTALSLAPFEAAASASAPTLSGQESAQRDVSLRDGAIVLSRRSAGHPSPFTLEARITPSPRWDFAGAALEARLAFPAGPLFGPPLSTPCQVAPDVEPPGIAAYAIRVTCVAPAALDAQDAAARRRIGNRRAVRDGVLEVRLRARGDAIRLGPQLQGWSFEGDGARLADPDPAVQGSIYRLGALLAGLTPAAISPVVARLPVQEKLYFFDPAPFVTGGLVILVLLGLVLLVRQLAAPRLVEITGGDEGPIRRKVRLAAAIAVRGDGQARATVVVTPAGFLVLRGGGAAPLVVGPGGGQIAFGPRGRKLSLRVEPGGRAASRRGSSRDRGRGR